jgi:hypothetical protein
MVDIILHCLNPPLWLYSAISVIVLSGLCTGHFLFRGDSTLASTLAPFKLHRFDVHRLGLPASPWIPAAFADLSRKRTVDIIYRRDNSRSVAIYRYSPSASEYRKFQQLLLPVTTIHAIVPIDYFRSGFNDLLIVQSGNAGPPYSFSLVRNNQGFFSSDPESLRVSSRSLPFVFDFPQTGVSDVLYEDFETEHSNY